MMARACSPRPPSRSDRTETLPSPPAARPSRATGPAAVSRVQATPAPRALQHQAMAGGAPRRQRGLRTDEALGDHGVAAHLRPGGQQGRADDGTPASTRTPSPAADRPQHLRAVGCSSAPRPGVQRSPGDQGPAGQAQDHALVRAEQLARSSIRSKAGPDMGGRGSAHAAGGERRAGLGRTAMKGTSTISAHRRGRAEQHTPSAKVPGDGAVVALDAAHAPSASTSTHSRVPAAFGSSAGSAAPRAGTRPGHRRSSPGTARWPAGSADRSSAASRTARRWTGGPPAPCP